MTTQPDYSKIYTHAPEQHPNLILGSFQLLFWTFFRPKAFRNHLKRIDPALDLNLLNPNCLRLKNISLYQLFLQVFFISPSLTYFIILLFLLALDIPIETISYTSLLSVLITTAYGGILGAGILIGSLRTMFVNALIFGMSFGIGLNIIIGISYAMNFNINSRIAGLVLTIPLGLIFGLSTHFPFIDLNDFYEFEEHQDNHKIQQPSKFTSAILTIAIYITPLARIFIVILFTLIVVRFIVIEPQFREALPSIIIGLTVNSSLSILLYPFATIYSLLIYNIDKKHMVNNKLNLLRYHPAFWNEWQHLPFINLNKYILLIAQRNPFEAKAAIEHLLNSRQCWAAQAVQIELDARMLEACEEINNIAEIASRLKVSSESPVNNILNNSQRISEDTKAALQQSSNYNQRLVLKPICEKIEAQIQELNRSDNKYAPRFQPIAIKWHAIISNHIEKLAKETELRQEIDSPYIIGVPLTLQQQIFIGRDDIGTRIEQLLLDRRRPPLLLYGQRRMGKTSLLNNLGKLLPNSIIPMFVDLQGAPSSAKDSTGFLFNLAKQMISSAKRQSALTLPPLTRETLQDDAFTNFDEWLDKVEETLEQNTALLMLDEFEVLDSAINKGRFDEEDILGMLRHLIQHRPKFKVLIAGSHTIEEYQRWASYLINVQVVNVSYLLEHEARQLIENPIEDLTLRYEADAVERILQLTRCHPFLVQLLCSELIALKNEQDPSVRRLATLDDVEAAIPEALNVGSLFFADIQNNQVDATGLEILRFIAAKGEKAIVSKETIALEFQDTDYANAIKLLLQRDLIEELDDDYCFQVELIRRWFKNKP